MTNKIISKMIIRGKANSIQLEKLISTWFCLRSPKVIALGGEPIGVPIPPILQAKAIPKVKNFFEIFMYSLKAKKRLS